MYANERAIGPKLSGNVIMINMVMLWFELHRITHQRASELERERQINERRRRRKKNCMISSNPSKTMISTVSIITCARRAVRVYE